MNRQKSHPNHSPGVCRTGVRSFRRVLPLLLSAGGEGATFSGAVGADAEEEL